MKWAIPKAKKVTMKKLKTVQITVRATTRVVVSLVLQKMTLVVTMLMIWIKMKERSIKILQRSQRHRWHLSIRNQLRRVPLENFQHVNSQLKTGNQAYPASFWVIKTSTAPTSPRKQWCWCRTPKWMTTQTSMILKHSQSHVRKQAYRLKQALCRKEKLRQSMPSQLLPSPTTTAMRVLISSQWIQVSSSSLVITWEETVLNPGNNTTRQWIQDRSEEASQIRNLSSSTILSDLHSCTITKACISTHRFLIRTIIVHSTRINLTIILRTTTTIKPLIINHLNCLTMRSLWGSWRTHQMPCLRRYCFTSVA